MSFQTSLIRASCATALISAQLIIALSANAQGLSFKALAQDVRKTDTEQGRSPVPVQAQQSRPCDDALLPALASLPQQTLEFYGDCASGRAINGLVIMKQRDIPFGLACLENGEWMGSQHVLNSVFVNQNSQCMKYLSALPSGCSKPGYRGQCDAAGEPNGVGYLHESSSSSAGGLIRDHTLYSGMIQAGKMNGVGGLFTIKACGYLGCTGGKSFEYAYFVAGNSQFRCKGGLLGCLDEKEQLAREAASADARRRQEEATYQSQLASSNPQAMYLAAGSYARDGDWSKAQALYNRIISKFPSSNWAVKASDQLDAQRRSSDAAARQSDEADQRQRERQRDKDDASRGCYSRIAACENSCPNIKYNSSSVVFACKERCRSLCTP